MLNDIESTEITERDNLAVVYRIERLEPILNKDRIELVHLKDCGYTVIAEKIHKVGDLVVFIKYDSIVPKIPMFEFLEESKYRVKQKGFTVRDEGGDIIAKIYSQGVVIPLQVAINGVNDNNPTAPKYIHTSEEAYQNEIGTDWTGTLLIKKYIPQAQGGGSSFGKMDAAGNFPTELVSKTDETNLAQKIRAIDELQGKAVYITKKMEGSSLTVTWDIDKDELMVCSRNNKIKEHETNKFWQAVNKYDLKTKLKDRPYLVLQGELCGPGIQKNKLGLTEPDVFFFNVSNKHKIKFTYKEIFYTCNLLKIKMVPIVAHFENFDKTFDELQELADKQVYENGEVAEGIVIRPTHSSFSKILKGDWSAKIINRDYRL